MNGFTQKRSELTSTKVLTLYVSTFTMYVEEPTRHVAMVTFVMPMSVYIKYDCSISEQLNKVYNSELSNKHLS